MASNSSQKKIDRFLADYEISRKNGGAEKSSAGKSKSQYQTSQDKISGYLKEHEAAVKNSPSRQQMIELDRKAAAEEARKKAQQQANVNELMREIAIDSIESQALAAIQERLKQGKGAFEQTDREQGPFSGYQDPVELALQAQDLKGVGPQKTWRAEALKLGQQAVEQKRQEYAQQGSVEDYAERFKQTQTVVPDEKERTENAYKYAQEVPYMADFEEVSGKEGANTKRRRTEEEAKKYEEEKFWAEVNGSAAPVVLRNLEQDLIDKYVSDQQLKVYNYLVNSGQQEYADEYWKSVLKETQPKRNQDEINRVRSAVAMAPEGVLRDALGSALSVGANMANAVAGQYYIAEQEIGELMDGKPRELDPNNAAFLPGMVRDALRQDVSEKLPGWGKFLYDTGISMADAAAMGLALGPTGGALLMGSGAAVDTVRDVKERGGSDQQALTMGVIAGAAEVLTEKIQFDRLDDLIGGNKTSVLREIAKNMYSESYEEGLTEIVNILADVLVMGDKSEYNAMVSQYIAQGIEVDAARKQAFVDLVKQVGLARLGGALSGGVMSGGSAAIGTAEKAAQRNAWRDAVNYDAATNIFTEGARGGSTYEYTRKLAQQAYENQLAQEAPVRATEALEAAAEANAEAAAQAPRQRAVNPAIAQMAQEYGDDAGVFMAYYEGGDEAAYKTGFDAMFKAGQSGLPLEMLGGVSDQLTAGMSEATKQAIYTAGRNKAAQTITPGAKNLTTKKLTSEQRTFLRVWDAIGKEYGFEVDLVDDVTGANGAYRTGGRRIVVSANAVENAYTQAAGHETVHYLKSVNPEGYQVLEDTVLKYLTDEDSMFDLETAIRERTAEYAGKNLTREEAIEEIVAEAVPTFFSDRAAATEFANRNPTLAEKIRDFFYKFVEKIREIAEKYTVSQNRDEIANLLGKTEALTEIAKTLDAGLRAAQEKAGEANSDGEIRTAGRRSKDADDLSKWTPDARFMEEIMTEAERGIFRTIMNDQKNLPAKKMPNGEYVIEAGRALVYTDGKMTNPRIRQIVYFYTNDGTDLDGAMDLWRRGEREGIEYERTRAAIENILGEEGAVVYHNDDFREVQRKDDRRTGTNGRRNGEGDRGEVSADRGTKFSLKDNAAFARWFGDSKIINADGTPKVMYHGSQASFTAFDKRKARSSGLYGRGFYFTDSDAHAGQYGSLYQVYLKVENPLTPGGSTTTKAQVNRFLEAVAENEDDYSIENYGTYDVDEIMKKVYKKDAFDVIQDVNATAIGDMVEAVKLFNEVNGTKFDGIVVPTETVVFEPTQIKSATDNIGTYDPENPDIRYSLKADTSFPTASEAQEAAEANRAQTETEAFRDWFDGSVVVNDDGSPKIMYHGTSRSGFNWFRTQEGKYGLMGMGAYFTDNPEVAQGYTRKGRGTSPGVYPVYLKITNPIDMDAKAGALAAEWQEFFGEELDGRQLNGDMTNEEILRIVEDALMDAEVPDYEAYDYFRDFYEQHDIDGITHMGGGRWGNGPRHRVYIALSGYQVKSATGNEGGFADDQIDIRYSLKKDQTKSEAFKKWFGDSKVVDEKGNPRVVYHQTSNDFTIFSNSKPEAGLNDSETPNGYFFKDNDHDIGLGGSKQMAVYLKMEKPLHFADRKEANAWYREHVAGYDELSQRYDREMAEFTAKLDDIQDQMFEDTEDERYDELSAAEDDLLEQMRRVEDDYRGKLRRMLDDYFLKGNSGYDGIELDYDGHRWVNGKRENVHTYIVFEPAQIKSATDNVGTYDLENPDIRYSLKSDQQKAVREAQADDWKQVSAGEIMVQDLKVDEETVRRQAAGALNKGLKDKLNQQISMAANRIIRDTESKYGRDELKEKLGEIVKEYARSGNAAPSAEALAGDIIEKSVRLKQSEAAEQYADARKKLRNAKISLTETQKQEIISEYGSIDAYRKAVFGTMNVRNEGVTLESLWGELSELYPEIFPPDTNEAQMPGVIAQFDRMMKPRYENIYGMDAEAAVTDLALRIQGDVLGMVGAKNAAHDLYGTADKFRKQIRKEYDAEIRAQQKARVDEFQRIAGKLKAARDKGDQTERQKIMAEYRRALKKVDVNTAISEVRAADKARYEQMNENREAAQMREKVIRRANELSDMLIKPKKGKRVPTKLQGLVIDVLGALDVNGQRAAEAFKETKQAAEFREKLTGIKNFYAQVWDSQSKGESPEGLDGLMMTISERNMAEMAEALEVLGSGEAFYLRDMDSKQLKSLDALLKNVKHTVESIGKLWRIQRYESIIQLGDASIAEMDSRGPQKITNSTVGGARDFFMLDNMEPVSYGERLGEAGSEVIQSLMDGEKIKFGKIREASEATEKMLKEVGISGYDIGKWRKHVQVVTLGGMNVRMTDAMLMGLYLTAKRPKGRQHLLGGGFVLRDPKRTGAQEVTIRPTEADLAHMAGLLSDKQRQMADRMGEYLSTAVAKWGNDVTQRMYLYDAYTEKHYWPLSSDSSYHNTKEPETDRMFNAIVNASFTKPTNPKADGELVIMDAFYIFGRHIGEVASYAGYAEAITDTMAWLNYRVRNSETKRNEASVKRSMKNLLGNGGIQYLINLVQDINGARRGGDNMQLNKLLGNYKKAVVRGKIRVAIQQPTSIVRAAAEINPWYLIKGLRPTKGLPKGKSIGEWLRSNGTIEEMQKWSNLAWWKSNGNYDIGIGKGTDAILWGDTSITDTVMEKIATQGGLVDPGKMDDLTWAHMWLAVKSEIKRKRTDLEVGSDEYFRAVAERFEYVMDRTQVVDTVMHRSALMRGKDGLVKSLTSFMSEPTKSYNMLMRAVMEVGRHPKDGAAHKKLVRTTLAYVASAAATAAATALYDAFRYRDDEEKTLDYLIKGEFGKDWAEQWLRGFMSNANLLDNIPGVSTAIGALKGEEATIMGFDTFTDIGTAYNKLMNYFLGDNTKKLTVYGAVSPAVKAASEALGLPFAGIMANVETLGRIFDPKWAQSKSAMATEEAAYAELYKAMASGDGKKALDIRTQLAKGMYGNQPKSPKEIDTGIYKELARQDERVMRAYEMKLAGNQSKELVALRKAIMADGFTEAQVNGAINYCETLTDTEVEEKDMEAELEAKLYSTTDLFSAVRNGDADDVAAVADYLESVSNASDPEKSIRSSISGEFREEYVDLVKAGQNGKARALAGKLAMVGIDQEYLDGWMKDSYKADMKEHVTNGSVQKALEAIDELKEYGMDVSGIVSSLNSEFKERYVELVNSGRRTEADRLGRTLQELDLYWKDGKTNYYRDEKLEEWLEED